jgi:hypothetical protein
MKCVPVWVNTRPMDRLDCFEMACTMVKTSTANENPKTDATKRLFLRTKPFQANDQIMVPTIVSFPNKSAAKTQRL